MTWPAALDLASAWGLDAAVTFLNHGSFGACPTRVLDAQSELRGRMERQPVLFLARDYQALLDAARAQVAAFVGASPADLVFQPNTTTAVSTVLRSLDLAPGDELLTTNHVYPACLNALRFVAERTGARLVIAEVPFPIGGPAQVIEPLLAAATERTRLALIDHVTSPTGLVFPVEEIVPRLQAGGIDVLVDGAHAPGMLELDIARLAPAYFAGNCHKWLCAPKGAAILVVRPDRQERIRPLAISHSVPRSGRSRFQADLDWSGTGDPTPALSVPAAIDHVASLLPGGWPAIRARNHAMALAARELLCQRLGIAAPAPASMLGSLAALPLPPAAPLADGADPLQHRLWAEHRVEVPVFQSAVGRLLRISAQLYNRREQYEHLAELLS